MRFVIVLILVARASADPCLSTEELATRRAAAAARTQDAADKALAAAKLKTFSLPIGSETVGEPHPEGTAFERDGKTYVAGPRFGEFSPAGLEFAIDDHRRVFVIEHGAKPDREEAATACGCPPPPPCVKCRQGNQLIYGPLDGVTFGGTQRIVHEIVTVVPAYDKRCP